MDDRSWAGKLRFWGICFWIVPDDDMDRQLHRSQARYGQVNNAFELDVMDDKTNLVAVISRSFSSSIDLLLGIPEHHMGPGVFRCLFSTNGDCRCFLGYQSSCLEQHLGAFGIVSGKRQKRRSRT